MAYRFHAINVALSALVLLCPSARSQTDAASQKPLLYTDAEAYKVYDALIPTDWTITIAHARRLLIQTETESTEFCLKPAPDSASLLQPLFDKFVALNKSNWILQPHFSLDRPYQLISRNELKSFFKTSNDEGWQELANRYPDSARSYIVVSPVAFNADHTLAVVYMGHSCGSSCGGGTFHVLEKKDGAWKPLRWNGTGCAWAS